MYRTSDHPAPATHPVVADESGEVGRLQLVQEEVHPLQVAGPGTAAAPADLGQAM